jgi:phosphoglycolate phosphatase-like HAD superfamily hydrolase
MQRLTSADDLQGFIRRRGPFGLCLWDFDGVVADTEPRQAAAYRRVLAARGIEPPADFFHALIGLTEPEIWDRLQANHDVRDRRLDLINERFEILRDLLIRDAPPNWFVRPALETLAAMGARSVIVSSGDPRVIAPYLASWGLGGAFETVSAHGPGTSPKSERIVGLLQGAEGATLMFEDVAAYLSLATIHGAVTIGVIHEFNASAELPADAVVAASGNGRTGPVPG